MQNVPVKRIEIFANQSVREEIEQGIESAAPNALYSVVENVLGKGRRDRKLGNATWPETNFALVSYATEEDCERIFFAVGNVKKRFPTEGIACFASDAQKVKFDKVE